MRARGGRAEDARRARLVLMLAAGRSYSEICRELGCSSAYVARWKERFQKDRLAGLDSRYAGRKAWVITAEMEARVLARTRQAPPDGSTHWSSRKLAKELAISHVTPSKDEADEAFGGTNPRAASGARPEVPPNARAG